MAKWLTIFLLILSIITIHHSPFTNHQIHADELEDIERQIAELEKARQQSINATKPLEDELDRLEAKLNAIQTSIKQAEENLVLLQESIAQREKDFERHYVLLAQRVESYYKNLRQPSKILTLLSSQTASSLAKDLAYRETVADEDKKLIAQISKDLLQLERDKLKVEQDKITLASLKEKTDEQAQFFSKEIKGAKAYQQDLTTQIAQLTARQQQIIAQRQASLNLPVSLGAGPLACVDDRDAKFDPGFSPAFAFFTYGIPHRVGMNQYGAYGRAQAGQNHEDILRAYFNNISFQTGKENIQIKVQGHGSMSLYEYTRRIYEVPASWPIEALKAQAVAARSYALAYTNNGEGEICTTQSCQVFKSSPKGGKWDQAVNETKGKIMVTGGQPVKAWYSSTDGGYTHTSAEIWGSSTAWTKNLLDASGSVSNFSQLQASAYDKSSPCFYAAQGSRAQYNKSAWLKSSEVADIANALLLAKADLSTKDHLYQPDKPHPYGGEVWSQEKVKQELQNKGITTFNSVNSVSVSADFGSGRTTNVTINGNAGSTNFGGDEFKNYFNIRAPANIQIVGPLYNVERK